MSRDLLFQSAEAMILMKLCSVQVRELTKSMLAYKSFEATSDLTALSRWLGILADELSERLATESQLNQRAPRLLVLGYRLYATHYLYMNASMGLRNQVSSKESKPNMSHTPFAWHQHICQEFCQSP